MKARKYPEEQIDLNFEKAKKFTRKELISRNKKNKNKNDGKIRLIFTYNEGNPPLYQWMREAKRCLVRNEKAKELGDCIQISV